MLFLLLLFVLHSRKWPKTSSLLKRNLCPEEADETNQGKEAPPKGRAQVSRGCAVSGGGSFLAYCSLHVGLTGPTVLCYASSFGDELAPEGSRDSHDSVLMLKSFRETFRLALQRFRCPPTMLHMLSVISIISQISDSHLSKVIHVHYHHHHPANHWSADNALKLSLLR